VVPPAGLRKGSKGLFGFGIVWCLIVAAITLAIGSANAKNVRGNPVVGWTLMGVFWLVGLGLLTGAINMARRRAMLLVENGQLQVAQIGIFGAKKWDWNRENIGAIRANASGMEINNVPVIELQIQPVNGKKVGFFAGRDQQGLPVAHGVGTLDARRAQGQDGSIHRPHSTCTGILTGVSPV